MPPLILHTRGDGVLVTPPEEVKSIAKQLISASSAVIHVHGGLVSAHSAREKAVRLHPYYASKGTTALFPIWESGLLEAPLNNLHEIPRTKLFRFFIRFVMRHAGGKIRRGSGGRGFLRTPLDDAEVERTIERALSGQPETEPIADDVADITPDEKAELERELEESAEFQEITDSLLSGLGVEPPAARTTHFVGADVETARLLAPDVAQELRESAASGKRGLFSSKPMIARGVMIAWRVVHRFANGRHHELYLTSVEEIVRAFFIGDVATWVWERMKTDCRQSFEESTSTSPRGGSLLLDALAGAIAERSPDSGPIRISIVAHSAGAIWSCHLLQRLDALRTKGAIPGNFRLEWLIFMAPAVRYDLLTTVLKLHRRAPLWEHFRLFGLSDKLERGYTEFAFFPASLLYMVSGMFEPEADAPIVGMARFNRLKAMTAAEGKEVWELLSQSDATVWSRADGGKGLASDVEKHGHFDATPPDMERVATMESIVHLVSAR